MSFDITELVNDINLSAKDHRYFLIGIDGNVGAGKTTLAQRLTKLLPAQLLSMDELYSDWQLPFTQLDQLNSRIAEIFQNFSLGNQSTYDAFDWVEKTWQKKTIQAQKFLVVEGVGALNPIINPHYHFRILLQCDPVFGMELAAKRDQLPGNHDLKRFVENTQEYLKVFTQPNLSDFKYFHDGSLKI
jgi:uridine kinase